jgi:signal transduction histidine kinase
MEKIKTEKLNTELKATNLKLKQYSKFTIAKERTRIAQELHDSIGHSLVALSMNLEYAENVVAIKPEKAKTTIQNCYTLSKDSLKTLRKAVSVLKETNSITNLRDDIEQIFINFKNTNTYKFNLDFDEQVEKFSREIKTCIFKILREAITNGIKHGNATPFNIHIYKSSNDIIFKIEKNAKK